MSKSSDSSDEESTPPNTQGAEKQGAKAGFVDYDYSSCGTATPPWLSPGHTMRYTKSGQLRAGSATVRSTATTPPIAPSTATPPVETPSTPPASARRSPSPTTSSPILLETPPRAPPRQTSRPSKNANIRRVGLLARRIAAGPYARSHPAIREPTPPVVDAGRAVCAPAEIPQRARPAATHPGEVFAPASWPCSVAHVREQYNTLATVFPSVPHFGWCDGSSPCRVDSCRNSKMNIYGNVNSCPFEIKCGNGLDESTKMYLGRNTRTSVFGVVASEAISAGEVIGQYLGEMEHDRVSRTDHPRNYGYRLMMKTRPEKPNRPVRVAINAQCMGGLMRFVNHSCAPVAKLVEVVNGRRTTVVVATTEDIPRGQEVTVDYGDDICLARWSNEDADEVW
uniref:SET domain-containing protein n=1 Tax=Phytophthora ramorum TaxID=164328 RepID=H3GVX3_PHYRM